MSHYIKGMIKGATQPESQRSQMDCIVLLGRLGLVVSCEKCMSLSRRCTYLLKGLSEWTWKFNGKCTVISYNYGDGQYICSDALFHGYGVIYNNDWLAGFINLDEFPADVGSLIYVHHWWNVWVPGE